MSALALACAATAIAAPVTLPEESAIDSSSGGDHVGLTPNRFDAVEVDPGRTLRYSLTVTNTTGIDVRLKPRAIPLEGSKESDQLATPGSAKSRSFEAVEWVRYPGFGDAKVIGLGRQLSFDVLVSVPEDARPGTYALGLGVAQHIQALGNASPDVPASRVDLEGIVASIAVFTVSGDARANARIRGASGPRLVWSGDRPTFRVDVENSGEVVLQIDSQVELNAFLGSAGRTLGDGGDDEGIETLPGGRRSLTMRWSDPPLLGWYQPKLVVVGGEGTGVRITKRLDTVYVLPPWWLILIVAIAIWLPVRSIRKRRRAMKAAGVDRQKAVDRVKARHRKAAAQRRAREARRKR